VAFSYFKKVFSSEFCNQKLLGLSSDVLVEAPHVENGTITGWDVIYGKNRQFGIDMAGFAVNLELILANW
jgi:hypothetical protein